MPRPVFPRPHATRPGQESVWDYPRPPRLEPTSRRIQVMHGGRMVADSRRAWRVLETSHPPVYYVPPEDVRVEHLHRAREATSFCEWKGRARYYDVAIQDHLAPRAAFDYPTPAEPFAPIAGYVAFYASRVETCCVDGELVRPQPGDFYAGWITSDLTGPFKGEPGSAGW